MHINKNNDNNNNNNNNKFCCFFWIGMDNATYSFAYLHLFANTICIPK